MLLNDFLNYTDRFNYTASTRTALKLQQLLAKTVFDRVTIQGPIFFILVPHIHITSHCDKNVGISIYQQRGCAFRSR
jgi:hypothetical protein